jgi:hypothetical protein
MDKNEMNLINEALGIMNMYDKKKSLITEYHKGDKIYVKGQKHPVEVVHHDSINNVIRTASGVFSAHQIDHDRKK